MLLTIDAGNTNTVFALFDGDMLVGQWRIHSNPKRTADEYAIWFTQLMRLHRLDPEQIKAAISSCVIPYALYDFKQLTKRYFGSELLVIGEAPIGQPIEVDLDKSAEAGADRLVNSYAAWQQYQQPAIVVDFGTATTFDVINSEGKYAGGIIAPGVHLSLEALQKAAAKLPNIGIKSPAKVVGKNTVDAMQSGIFYGYADMVEGLIKRIKDEMALEMKVIATGGLAPLYAKAITQFDTVDQELTIRGLKEIYKAYFS